MKMYAKLKDEKYLLSILDSEAKKIISLQESFWNEWNTNLRVFLECENSFNIKDYSCIYGGFTLSLKELESLSDGLRKFFVNNGKGYHNRFYLRGFSYYAADPLMYLHENIPTDYIRWQIVINRWQNYKDICFKWLPIKTKLRTIDWIALISLFEYMYNDLTTIFWTVKKVVLDEKSPSVFHEELNEMEKMTDILASILSELILLNQNTCIENIVNRTNVVISNTLKITNWDANVLKENVGYVRAIREADSTPLLYAAYLKKLLPWAKVTQNDILLLSNAYGAMNVSLILQHMLNNGGKCQAGNVYYSQNRLDSHLFGIASELVVLLNSNLKITTNATIVIIDDCIFTGKTYKNIKGYFHNQGFSIMMLPLAFDINSLKYCRIFSKNIDELVSDAENAIEIAEELYGTPPAFVAFWEWDEIKSMASDDNVDEFAKVLNGGDQLRKELWIRYKDNIL